MLEKQRVVMQHFQDDDGLAFFEPVTDEDEEHDPRQVIMREEDWLEMGGPLEITVTIEPGNTIEE